MATKKAPTRVKKRRDHHLPDDDIDARGGALPKGEDEIPAEAPDTQESLYSSEHAYRVDEDEGHGPRHLTPIDAADGSERLWLPDEEIDRVDRG